MTRWIALTLFAVVLLGSALGVTVLAVEWRQDTTDLGPLATEVADLRTDVEEIRALLEATPRPTATQITATTPTPTPQPTVAKVEAGSVAEGGGLRLTIEAVSHDPESIPGIIDAVGTIDFILENVDAPPEATDPFVLSVSMVDSEGFVCQTLKGDLGPGGPVQLGEKTRFNVIWDCPDAKTLTIGSVRFEFP